MSIIILAVGKLKGTNKYLQAGVDEYVKRMSVYRAVTLVEIPEETISATRTDEQIKESEGERVLAQVAKYAKDSACQVVALSENGKEYGSFELSERLFGMPAGQTKPTNQPNGGTPWAASNPIIFIIGGPLGLSRAVLAQCHTVLSLSRLTFPHPMARLFLVEQLYRAFKIYRNEPYHKA